MSYGNKKRFIEQVLFAVTESVKELEAAHRRGFLPEDERIAEYNEIIETASKMLQEI